MWTKTWLADDFWHVFGAEFGFFDGVGTDCYVFGDFAFSFGTGAARRKIQNRQKIKIGANTIKKNKFGTKNVPKIVYSPSKAGHAL